MAETTHISWADATFSPWTGCTKISPACDGCYAAHLMDTRMGRVEWGEPGAGEGTRSLMSDAYWRKPLAWDREAARTGVRPWVFPSLCDPFDTAVEPAWRWRFIQLMEATPNVIYLLLTKRIGNVRRLTDPMRGELPLPPNHALLATIANQTEADRDLDKLMDAARVTEPLFTGVSMEPLLSHVDISPWLESGNLNWVITGGETDQGAHKARPSNPQWFRDLRDQCAKAAIPFHFKQWGEWVSVSEAEGPGEIHTFADHRSVRRLGKVKAGRTLDGAIHDARPSDGALGAPRTVADDANGLNQNLVEGGAS